MQEQTLVLIKPDGLKRSLTGNVITRLSEAKLEILAAKVVSVSEELAKEHYQHLKNEKFFLDLIRFLRGEFHDCPRVMAMVYQGEDAIAKVRELAGATNPEEADPTSIRGSYGRIHTSGLFENVMHASENLKEAEREIKLWFDPDEIVEDLYPSQEKTQESVRQNVWS